jgi:ribosomal protein S18 acetylase RimI-like enzyme
MPEIEIRTVNSKDFESLSAFEHGFYTDYVWQMGVELHSEKTNVEFRRVRLPRRVHVSYPRQRQDVFKDPESAAAFLMAIMDNRPVGYIKLKLEKESNNVHITDLVVSSSMRRQGIASGLVISVLDLANHRQYASVVMEIQLKNDPYIQLAQKTGFSFSGFCDFYFPNQETALFYTRHIK